MRRYAPLERKRKMAYYEITINIPEAFRDGLIQELTRNGCLGAIENEQGMIAYFPDSADMRQIFSGLDVVRALVQTTFPGETLRFTQALIQEQDWNESWKKGFTPLDVGERFTVLPPWEKMRENRINLVIDPGMAFGTGHHETTRSCIVLMEKYDGKTAKDRFLDLGTGTGLLAIAASKLGFKQILAVDTDPLAVEAARMNIGLNQVHNVEIREGSIPGASGLFDVIAANIISGVLVLLAPHIAARLNTPGMSVLSGILSGQEGEVIAAMKTTGLKLIEVFRDDKWISLVVGR